ncbi:hypothetical protein BJ742DRAFT_899480 [Cladochytrium replicatum]|nr:hypothetical protein BJ742DRAFT_899480 [Cladochytrium replicatum]
MAAVGDSAVNIRNEFRRLLADPSLKEWNLASTANGGALKCYSRQIDEPKVWPHWMGITVLPFPAEVVFALVTDGARRPQWDSVMPVYDIVREIPTPDVPELTAHLTYCVTSSMLGGLIAARDYEDVRVLEVHEIDGRKVLDMSWASMPEPEAPPRPGAIRGSNFVAGLRVEELGPNESKLYYMIRSDLKGQMSSWVVNKGMVSALTSITTSIRKTLEADAKSKK